MCGDKGYFSECPPTTEVPPVEEEDYDPPRRPTVHGAAGAGPGGTIRIQISAESGSRIIVRYGSRRVFSGTASGGTQTVSFRGLNGTKRYVVTATDAAGNVSGRRVFRATADSVAPSGDATSIETGTAENALSHVSFDAEEPVRFTVRLDGSVVRSERSESGAETVDIPMANGRHRVELRMSDRAGNVKTSARNVKVAVPELAPVVKRLTEDNEPTQSFEVTGTPGSRGTLSVAGNERAFVLRDGGTRLDLPMTDGTYDDVQVAVRDSFGRKGAVSVDPFVVDTLAPTMTVKRLNGDAQRGRFVARLVAEDGASVVWSIVDEAGHVLEDGSFASKGAPQVVDEDVEEGAYTLKAKVTDDAGNVTDQDLQADVATDPLTLADWLIVLGLLAALALAAAAAWLKRARIAVWWRQTRHRLRVAAVRRKHAVAMAAHTRRMTQHDAAVARHEVSLRHWDQRRAFLEGLLAAAEGHGGAPLDRGAHILGAKAKSGERSYGVFDATLVDRRTRQNVPVLVDVERGRIAVTNLRVLFQGPGKKREWMWEKAVSMQHVRSDCTLIEVTNRKAPSGISYSDVERVQLFLDLAYGDSRGSRDHVIQATAAKLHQHVAARPADPPPPPTPPETPSLLRDEDDRIRV